MTFEPNISLNKIGYAYAHKLGRVEDYFLREKIKFEAIQFRAFLIRRDLERNFITRDFIQYICIDLVCKDLSDCCNDPSYSTGLRTVDKIPTPLRTKDFDSFYFVGTADKKTPFKEVTFDTIDLMSERKFTAKKPIFVYDGNYVWIFNQPTRNFSKLAIGSVFEDPRQLSNLMGCDGTCYTDDDKFPMGADQYPALEEYLDSRFLNEKPNEDKQIKINDN